MPIEVLFASVPVANLARAAAWYELLFGRPPDVIPNESEQMWQAAGSAWLYVIADAARAGQTVVTLCVSDLDGTLDSLESRGLTPSLVETIGDVGRKAWLADPDHNSIAIIEVRGPVE